MSSSNNASAATGRKRPLAAEASFASTKSRSKLPRRSRVAFLPVVHRVSDNGSVDPAAAEGEADSSSTGFSSGLSHESRVIGSSGSGAAPNEFHRITRSYTRRIREGENGRDPKRSKFQVNESDLVADVSDVVEEFNGGDEISEAPKMLEKEPEVSFSSCLDSFADANGGGKSTMEEPAGRSQISQNSVAPIREPPGDRDLDSDLACSERISHESEEEERSEYSTCNEMTLSQMEDVLFGRYSSGDVFTDFNYSSSVIAASSSSSDGFSKKSHESAAPTATLSLLHQLSRQFCSASYHVAPATERESFQEFTLMKFEEQEDEESYQKLRSRERGCLTMYDFAKEYRRTTEQGRLILDQRIVMVNWMVEHSNAMDLKHETLFLGVSLMDRFLSRGYFKSIRNLQLSGIASITLATRIEENQPYNSIRQVSFKVGTNYYSRSEVVAMEWLVQEVLRFKCFVPTTHNFLWFYLKAARADANVQKLSKYLAVLSLLDHERLSFWPSSIAAGLVILACLATNQDDACQMVMEVSFDISIWTTNKEDIKKLTTVLNLQTHVRTKNDDLPECMQSLQWLVKYAC
ncbi:hypothetical protein ZIOFF_067508 [Zingiber officinale]|uniref:Cyclin N-terminal domain-containing protein n=1 Tax=Zingiber officinale TaxID=94328 RepID=A0A8J5CDF8_ZINOF|nr:hypothetical protein ZIOFF_067508 [Zingiber officinale]